jgi:rhomboid protease GluP
MSFNLLLIQFVGFSCVLILLRSRHLPKGWVTVAAVILLILAATFWLTPDWAGWISGSLFGFWILLPGLLLLHIERLNAQERYGQARCWATGLRWLHPADGLFEYPILLRALELGHQGQIEAATQSLSRLCHSQTAIGRNAQSLVYRLTARWDELRRWLEAQFGNQDIFADPSAAGIYYLRALGETNSQNQLLQGVERLERRLEKAHDRLTLNLARLYAVAFCGQTEAVQLLFQGPLRHYSPTLQQFWLTTAALYGGQPAARDQLLALRDRSDAVQRRAIDWRFSHPPDPKLTLTPTAQQILARIEHTIRQEVRYGSNFIFIRTRAYATSAVVMLNLLMFALELTFGGSTNSQTLYRLGALVPVVVLRGEWWRLVAATLLHYGFLHLFVNVLGLYFFGRLVENKLGAARFLIVYWFSAIGSMLAILAVAIATQDLVQLGVGASGGVMGLIGAIIALMLRGWRRDKAPVAARNLRLMLFTVAIQTLSDVLTPQISLVGHLGGLACGFCVTTLLMVRQKA